jgi:hypothetical protein
MNLGKKFRCVGQAMLVDNHSPGSLSPNIWPWDISIEAAQSMCYSVRNPVGFPWKPQEYTT